MDHFGEDTLAEMPPDVVLGEPGRERLVDTPDIDVPFTPAAQRVIERSAELADLVGGEAVISEHLLLAITSTPECAAAKLIAEQGSSSVSVLSALQSVLGGEAKLDDEQENPRLERVIIRAKREAFRNRHSEVSTLHLLMALIRERAGAGYQKLTGANRVSAGASDRD
jgi:ATP-dependent Clp protease ATP-binding subunit ClpA